MSGGLETFVFNVGNGNFVVAVDGNNGIVLDCGVSLSSPAIASKYRSSENGAGIADFQNILSGCHPVSK